MKPGPTSLRLIHGMMFVGYLLPMFFFTALVSVHATSRWGIERSAVTGVATLISLWFARFLADLTFNSLGISQRRTVIESRRPSPGLPMASSVEDPIVIRSFYRLSCVLTGMSSLLLVAVFLIAELPEGKLQQRGRELLPVIYACLFAIICFFYHMRYWCTIRLDADGITFGPEFIARWAGRLEWSEISSCKLVLDYRTSGAVTLTPIFTKSDGQAMLIAPPDQFSLMNRRDRERLMDRLIARFPELESDPVEQ